MKEIILEETNGKLVNLFFKIERETSQTPNVFGTVFNKEGEKIGKFIFYEEVNLTIEKDDSIINSSFDKKEEFIR